MPSFKIIKIYLFYFNYTERFLEGADIGVCGLRWLRKPENPWKTGTVSMVNCITTHTQSFGVLYVYNKLHIHVPKQHPTLVSLQGCTCLSNVLQLRVSLFELALLYCLPTLVIRRQRIIFHYLILITVTQRHVRS